MAPRQTKRVQINTLYMYNFPLFKLTMNTIFFTVARMCYDSSVSGTMVYIDTTGAQATENSTGPLCECTINLYNAKLVMLNIVGANAICGSELNLKIESSGTVLKTNENCTQLYLAYIV